MSDLVVPDPVRARRLSDEVNRRLCASLAYVFEAAGAELDIEAAAAHEWLSRLAQARHSVPLVHANYHALVADIQNGDFAAAKGEAARLLRYDVSAPRSFSILNLDDTALGEDAIALFSRFADIEEENRLDLVPAKADDIARFNAHFAEAGHMMANHHPELQQEFDALVDTLLLVGQSENHRFTLGAVSCFETWGGLFLNPALQTDALDLVATIAHECTHLQLFAMALDEPLVLNPREERHYSPLREAPRSMDGIFHATIVSARMAYALRRQHASHALSPALAALAPGRMADSVRLFDEGLAVVRAHGHLSPLGESILQDAIALVHGDSLRLSA